ncbi:universal stress protein A-like protein [Magnolia sinica]|uniref:universal stress protein A-like protein n=1 Tax=Magnolia sinica TaxID=86752 RepID=UPI002658852F|nr:universal stress protein A-like protein [Magnolia sinica]
METKEERRILVAVDGGDERLYALSWCLKNIVSDNYKDTLIPLYAKPPPTLYPYVEGTGYLFSSDVIASVEKYSNDLTECVIEKCRRVCRDSQNKVKVENGDPRDVVCEMSEKLKTDVLVLGSHGYGFIKRALLGSVSNHCAQNAKCPVLIVKKPKH